MADRPTLFLSHASADDALPAWQRAGGERHFSLEVDGGTADDAPQEQKLLAREAATALIWKACSLGARASCPSKRMRTNAGKMPALPA